MRPPSTAFAKAIGFDFIILPDGDVRLIELQHHFGRSGMMALYPAVSRSHRKITRLLRERYGACRLFGDSLRRICASKIETYRMLSEWQPRSFVYQGWGPKVEAWLGSITAPYVLFKPPRGSCGRGITVHVRQDLREGIIDHPLSGPVLLQEYVRSRSLYDESSRPHVGCIRHIAHIFSSGEDLGFIHLPSYWRVAPAPYTATPDRRSFTANISSGARPAALGEGEAGIVRRAAEKVAMALTRKIRRAPSYRPGPTGFVKADGAVCWDGTIAPAPDFAAELPATVDKPTPPSVSKGDRKDGRQGSPDGTAMKKDDSVPPKELKGLERRRHIRLSLMGLARLVVRGGTPQDVYMGCIGRGGAGLYMHEEVKAGQLVVLEMSLIEENQADIEMKFAARVRYCRKMSQLYMIGLQFEKMAEDRYALLLRHLKAMKELQL